MSTVGSTPAAAASSLLGLAAVALVAACTSVNSTTASFEGTRWRVASINGQPTPASDLYRVEFAGGQIGGRFGCNQFGGPYRVERQLLITGDIASTLIGCPEPAATHEAQAFAMLRQPMRIGWHSDRQLTLSNSTGSIALERAP